MSRFAGVAVAIAALTAGCAASPSPAGRRVADADDRMVAECSFLGMARGSSGFGNALGALGLNNARAGALDEAAALGATHVVWTDERTGFVPTAQARAYRR